MFQSLASCVMASSPFLDQDSVMPRNVESCCTAPEPSTGFTNSPPFPPYVICFPSRVQIGHEPARSNNDVVPRLMS
jgi:hypothetical protein